MYVRAFCKAPQLKRPPSKGTSCPDSPSLFPLQQQFSTAVVFFPREHSATSRDMFGCHTWERRGDPGIEWEESRGVASHPAVCKAYPAPGVNYAEAERP